MNLAGGWMKRVMWDGRWSVGPEHPELELNVSFVRVCVCVCVCANKIVDSSEQKIVNNKFLKTTSENV